MATTTTTTTTTPYAQPNAFTIPLDLNHPLNPTRALAIHLPSAIQDLTTRLPALYSPTLGITNEHLLSAHKASILPPPPPTDYLLEKQNLIGTHLAVLDAEGNEVAEWRLPMLRFGRGVGNVVEVKFPRGSGEADVMEMRRVVEGKGKGKEREQELGPAVGMGQHHHVHHRRAESFVKDGVAYFWEVEPEVLHQKALFKVVRDENGKARKREVARFAQQNAREREGLLVLDRREVDELLVILTICAMIEAKDTFLK